MATPLPEDVLLTNFKNRCALAVLQSDPEAAMQLLRDFDAVQDKLFLSIIPPQAGTPAVPEHAQDS